MRWMRWPGLNPGYAENLALWLIDHAQHDNPATSVAKAHTVRLDGPLQQGLRDLSQWGERGVRPPDTKYMVIASQVLVPETASERGRPLSTGRRPKAATR